MVPLLVIGIGLVLAAEVPWGSTIAGPALTAAGYLAAVVMLWQNRARPWLPVLLVGAALNAAVILANAGRMPVSRSVFERIGRPLPGPLLAGTDPRHVLAGPGSLLGWLADRLAFHAGGVALVFSLGDLVMAVGVAGFVQAVVVEGGI